MTRKYFDYHYAASADNWYDAQSLDRINDIVFTLLAGEPDEVDENVIKSAFDAANNLL